MAKALVVYATRRGQTQAMAELIAEGVRSAGVQADCVNATDVKREEDLAGYDAYVLGSATYHGEMMAPMKALLFVAAKVELQGKRGGSFGAYGWSGEAPGRIFDTMAEVLKMSMVGGPLMLGSASSPDGQQKARDYGREMAEGL